MQEPGNKTAAAAQKPTVGILYLCTGSYKVFWPDFYTNFEQYFMPECAKTYFVFTDADPLPFAGVPNVRVIPTAAQPWPMSTLLRFDAFLGAEGLYAGQDYLFFANANLRCTRTVAAAELLPQTDAAPLTVVCHLPYYGRPPMFYPYDRNPRCRAYIPYNCGQYYVAGGLNGGRTAAYLQLCRTLQARTKADLDDGVVARYHDESQLNRLVAESPQRFRIAPPAYCTPEETPTSDEAIRVLQKANWIDIDKVKAPKKPQSLPARKWGAFCENYLPYAHRLWDSLLHKTVT